MIESMTGFGSREAVLADFGRVNVELRSTNHKFFEVVFHLPEELISLEDKIKKELEAKIKRGRLTCVISIQGAKSSCVSVNHSLLKDYLKIFQEIKNKFSIQDEPSINTLIHLPGVLIVEEARLSRENIWPLLKKLAQEALGDLLRMRQKEGRALQKYLKGGIDALQDNLQGVKARFKKAIAEKLKDIPTDEERCSFLKDTDITEELDRLTYHARNFKNKLSGRGPVGKELDFIAQEMQRETNTLAAKSFDALISTRGVQIKSQIEKLREQAQNIE